MCRAIKNINTLRPYWVGKGTPEFWYSYFHNMRMYTKEGLRIVTHGRQPPVYSQSRRRFQSVYILKGVNKKMCLRFSLPFFKEFILVNGFCECHPR